MQEISFVEKYYKARLSFFKWRYSLSFTNKFLLSIFMACATGIFAQIKISIPWTPVPITAQTLAVLLSGVILGKYWGGVSQLLYVLIGTAGIPWFSGATGGFQVLIGPTGGYLSGFVLASLFIGYFSDKFIKTRNFITVFGIMTFANFVLIHIPGLIQLSFWFKLMKNQQLDILNLLWMGTIPFITGDIIKIIIASTLAKAITPKQPYGI